MTAPAHEWPTRTTGPSAFRSARLVAAAFVVQRVERVLDCNDLESGLFEIRNDFLPARPVRKRTVDKDCGLGFQLGSRSWQADRGHRGQKDAQAQNAFARFHSYVPSFGGGSPN